MTYIMFEDFEERSKEVRKYFIFLKNLEQSTIRLSMLDGRGNPKIKEIDSELLKTLKASGFLLLYNLVEATMRNAIEAIFDELKNQGVPYDHIRPELKKVVLKNLKKRNPDRIFASITAISVDIITAGFDKDKLFSGNLDGLKIRKTAQEYGFSHLTDHFRTGDGSDLRTVKQNRNDLAHGFKTFTEVGRDKTTDELLEIENKAVRYLKQILLNIEQYLTNKDYLDASSSSIA